LFIISIVFNHFFGENVPIIWDIINAGIFSLSIMFIWKKFFPAHNFSDIDDD